MTKEQSQFLKDIDARYYKQKRFWLSVIGGFVAIFFVIWVTSIRTSASNSIKIETIQTDVSLIKDDYVDVFMFNKLVRTFELQHKILLDLNSDRRIDAELWQKEFEELRNEILFDIKPTTRGEKNNGDDN